jgi:hypothetical protein
VVRGVKQWVDAEDALVAQIQDSAHATVLGSREPVSS